MLNALVYVVYTLPVNVYEFRTRWLLALPRKRRVALLLIKKTITSVRRGEATTGTNNKSQSLGGTGIRGGTEAAGGRKTMESCDKRS